MWSRVLTWSASRVAIPKIVCWRKLKFRVVLDLADAAAQCVWRRIKSRQTFLIAAAFADVVGSTTTPQGSHSTLRLLRCSGLPECHHGSRSSWSPVESYPLFELLRSIGSTSSITLSAPIFNLHEKEASRWTGSGQADTKKHVDQPARLRPPLFFRKHLHRSRMASEWLPGRVADGRGAAQRFSSIETEGAWERNVRRRTVEAGDHEQARTGLDTRGSGFRRGAAEAKT